VIAVGADAGDPQRDGELGRGGHHVGGHRRIVARPPGT
jgi:hypothetical protein